MSTVTPHIITTYFTSNRNYFWSWEDNGEVVTFPSHHTTIGYREDIVMVLKDLSKSISPNFGSVLLVLYACSPFYVALTYEEVRQLIDQAQDDQSIDKQALEYHILNAFRLLSTINALPDHLKKSQKRSLLITEVLKNNPKTHQDFSELISLFESGDYDNTIFLEKEEISFSKIMEDILVLSRVQSQFTTTEILQEKLETGVVEIQPATAYIEEEDVLTSITKDRNLAFLSDIARYLMVGLKIPVSSQEEGDLSLGGVSDITNKGNFDKLLLSELAYDNDMFLSRLINNESLYFKREAPPENLQKNRVILLDATIRVWGTPRIIGLALALAFKYHPKSKINTKLFLLEGETHIENTLNDASEIKKALQLLSAHLECSISLENALTSNDIQKDDDVLFVVEASNFKQENVQQVFNRFKKQLDFLVTIAREGTVNYYSLQKGTLKELGNVHVDIDTVVNKKRTFGSTRTKKNLNSSSLNFIPAFFEEAPVYPLLHTLTAPIKEEHSIKLPEAYGGMIIRNRFNELVYYHRGYEMAKSGQIIKNNIGAYHSRFTLNPDGEKIYVLTYTVKKLAGFSTIYLSNFHIEYQSLIDRSFKPLKHPIITDYYGKFYIQSGGKKYIFDPETVSLDSWEEEVPKKKEDIKNRTLLTVTPFIKINMARISEDPYLVFNNKCLIIMSYDKFFHLVPRENYYVTKQDKPVRYQVTENVKTQKKARLFDNSRLKFRNVIFKDGSEIIFDNKGYAHLKSSDNTLPEVTIKLTLNGPVSIWTSNNLFCGEKNIANNDMNLNHVDASIIQEEFLTPFIHTIVNAY